MERLTEDNCEGVRRTDRG